MATRTIVRPLHEALAKLDVIASQAALIGDSITDIEAAERAHMKCVAFANKPWKIELFHESGVPTVQSMAEIDPQL